MRPVDAPADDLTAHLFRPLRLRHRTLRARINFGAHTANMAVEGLPSPRHVGYYRERARGGAGMIVVEPVPVHRTGVLTRGNFLVDDDATIPGFRAIVDACRAERTPADLLATGSENTPDGSPDGDGAADGQVVMIQQLYHVGQHGDADNSFAPNFPPSGLPSYHDADGSHAMTAEEIREVIDGFVSCARRAQRAGFDGVEVFAAYHAIVDQFWTPWSNRRTDEWGGSFDNRMRFSATILGEIRAACGDDFIVGLAVSVDPGSPASLSIGQLAEVVAWHDERRLIDYVTCGTGSYFDFFAIIPPSLYPPRLGVDHAAALKSVCRHALVQCESHVRTAQAAAEVIAAGQADMVSIVRGQIADPYLVAKARAGRADETRGCISCNQLCWGRRSRDYWISCLVNPSAGREFEWGGDTFERTANPRRVLVVGGGPAGLEAARVAAERGHRVTLVEATAHLGGQFRLAGHQPTRHQITELIDWYARELHRLDVELRTETRWSADEIARQAADEVVVAVGAAPARAGFQRALPLVGEMPGADHRRVVAIDDVLDGSVEISGTVILLDDLGDWRGIGTGMFLAEQGCAVKIVTSAAVVAGAMAHPATDGPARRRFAQAGGRMLPHTVIETWHGDRASMRSTLTAAVWDEAADWLVIAETPVANTGLSSELAMRGIAHRSIGDCVAPRRASLAIFEARAAALAL